MELFLLFSIVLLIVGIAVNPIRKAIGLLLVILGTLECLSVFGIVLGIPSILIGGIMLFYKGKSREYEIREEILKGNSK